MPARILRADAEASLPFTPHLPPPRMINVRLASALALLLGAAGVALGVIALFATIRQDDDPPGRLVQTRLLPFDGDPVYFPLDEFYASTDGAGRLTALYAYPPGYFGHVRGCRVVWIGGETVENAGNRFGPGLFVDPCGGARFDRGGALVQGPADRSLDYFATQPGLEGVIVDTRELLCGPSYEAPAPVTPQPSSTSAPARSSVTSTRPGTATATPTATLTPTPTATSTRTATAAVSPSATPTSCERVSRDAD